MSRKSLVAITVPDDAYAAGWNGSTEVPTKNAIYDKIETIGAGADEIYVGSTAPGDTSLLWADTSVSASTLAVPMWIGTQAQYNALGSYDANTLYFVTA